MNLWSKHLYLRIWLAVVLGVAVLMTLVGWAWQRSVEHNINNPPQREWIVRNAQGEVRGMRCVRMELGAAEHQYSLARIGPAVIEATAARN